MKRLDSFDDLSRVKKQSDKSVEKFGAPPKRGNTLIYYKLVWLFQKKGVLLQTQINRKVGLMVKSYQRKRTREELLAGFKLAVTKKREWLKAHNLKELNVTEV